jgi:hypothetical protein
LTLANGFARFHKKLEDVMRFLCLVSLLLLSCSKPEIETPPAQANTFKKVYTEFLLAKSSNKQKPLQQRACLDSLLQAHQLSKQDFDSVKTWYQNHPAAFESFSTAVTQDLQQQLQKKASDSPLQK